MDRRFGGMCLMNALNHCTNLFQAFFSWEVTIYWRLEVLNHCCILGKSSRDSKQELLCGEHIIHWFLHHWFIHFIHSDLRSWSWDSSLVHSFIIQLLIDLFIIDSFILFVQISKVGFESHFNEHHYFFNSFSWISFDFPSIFIDFHWISSHLSFNYSFILLAHHSKVDFECSFRSQSLNLSHNSMKFIKFSLVY